MKSDWWLTDNLNVLFVDVKFANDVELRNDILDVLLDVILSDLVFHSKWELDCEFNLEIFWEKFQENLILSH